MSVNASTGQRIRRRMRLKLLRRRKAFIAFLKIRDSMFHALEITLLLFMDLR